MITLTLQTPATAAENEKWPVYGNPADVAAIRQTITSRPWGVPHLCTRWTSEGIVVVGSYALVGTRCDFGQNEFFAKRGGVWAVSIHGKPNVRPCELRAKNVPHSVIVQLFDEFYPYDPSHPKLNVDTKAWVEKELKNNCSDF
jgi:hypothetical protein